MTFRLLALDLDGTVMGPDLVITPEVRRAVAAARDHGVHVTVATGRSFNAMLPFVEQLGIEDPVICYQGALVRHPVTREVYAHTPVLGALAAEVVDLLQQSGIYVIAYVDEWTCVSERRPELDLYLQFHPGGEADVRVVSNLVEYVTENPVTKLLFIAEPQTLDAQMASLAAHFTDTLAIVRSYAYFGEVTAPGITKGAALSAMAARLGIAPDQVIAIGDEENDLSMLAWAGLGLAMGNAPLNIRELADAVVPPVAESGVAWAIKHHLLNGQVRYRDAVREPD